jgi:hypothetical protein
MRFNAEKSREAYIKDLQKHKCKSWISLIVWILVIYIGISTAVYSGKNKDVEIYKVFTTHLVDALLWKDAEKED